MQEREIVCQSKYSCKMRKLVKKKSKQVGNTFNKCSKAVKGLLFRKTKKRAPILTIYRRTNYSTQFCFLLLCLGYYFEGVRNHNCIQPCAMMNIFFGYPFLETHTSNSTGVYEWRHKYVNKLRSPPAPIPFMIYYWFMQKHVCLVVLNMSFSV